MTRARLAALVATLLAVVVGLASPASAHASLVGSEPVGGAQLNSSPPRIEVRFDESVGIPPGALRLFDQRGHQVTLGRAGHDGPSAIAAPVTENLGNGLYVVAWRAVSADTHPVQGAYTFQVGAAASGADVGALDRRHRGEPGRQ